jgi:signal transduction histidine kinase
MESQDTASLHYQPLPPPGEAPDALSPQERAVLDTVNQKVAAAASLPKLIDFLFQATRDICPCDRVGVAFIEEEGRLIRSYYSVADYEPLLIDAGYSEVLEKSSLRRVIDEGAVRLIDDLEAYYRQHPNSVSTRLILREGVRSNMTCPLRVDDRNVGVLFRSSRRPRAYTAHQVSLHLHIAERLGQAVEKAYRIEQLRSANLAYAEMLGFVSHELKSPVASLVTDATLLVEGYLGPMTDEQRKKVRRMIAKGNYLLGLVREYLDLARIEGGELRLNLRRVDDFLGEVIDQAIDIVLPQIEDQGMSLERSVPEAMPPVDCDPSLLRIVLVNLLSNAVKYGRPRGRIRVQVVLEDATARVTVWNEGPGFPESAQAVLFRKFSRVHKPELMQQKGTGVGLYTSLRIIQLHGGRIWATSEEGHWAQFAFHIPLNKPQPADDSEATPTA